MPYYTQYDSSPWPVALVLQSSLVAPGCSTVAEKGHFFHFNLAACMYCTVVAFSQLMCEPDSHVLQYDVAAGTANFPQHL